jgi:hypothetical protein
LECTKQLLGDHFRGDTYFKLVAFVPPAVLRQLSQAEMEMLEAMIEREPWNLCFAHSVAAHLMESVCASLNPQAQEDGEEEEEEEEEEELDSESADEELTSETEEEDEENEQMEESEELEEEEEETGEGQELDEEKLRAIQEEEQRLNTQLAQVLHYIPELRGADALGKVIKAVKLKKKDQLGLPIFVAADAYVPLMDQLRDHAVDVCPAPAQEEHLDALLSTELVREVVSRVNKNKIALPHLVDINERLVDTIQRLLDELPRSADDQDSALKRVRVSESSYRRSNVNSELSNKLQEAADTAPLVLVRAEGVRWLYEYAGLFQLWRYPPSHDVAFGTGVRQRAVFVSPTYAHSAVFFQHMGFCSLTAERAELGREVHTRHLHTVLQDARLCPHSIHYLVLESAAQFDSQTLLETLTLGLDVFPNLRCVIMIGDDMLYPAPARQRPLEMVDSTIPPVGYSFGAPFHDLVRYGPRLPGTLLMRHRYKQDEELNAVSETVFHQLQLGLEQLRKGLPQSGIHLSVIHEYSSDPSCTRTVASLIRLWEEEAIQEKDGRWYCADAGLGKNAVMLVSTPSHWSKERAWAAAAKLSAELRLEAQKKESVDHIR